MTAVSILTESKNKITSVSPEQIQYCVLFRTSQQFIQEKEVDETHCEKLNRADPPVDVLDAQKEHFLLAYEHPQHGSCCLARLLAVSTLAIVLAIQFNCIYITPKQYNCVKAICLFTEPRL